MTNHESLFPPTRAIPRVYLEDPTIRVETKRHHLLRYQFAAGLRPGSNRAALDLCCGSGYGTAILGNAGYSATGIDRDEYAVQDAHLQYPGNQYVVGDVVDFLQNSHDPVDLVTFFEALEHVSRDQGQTIFKEVKRLLNLDGLFVVSTPRDIKKGENPWHITQWDVLELQNTLGKDYAIVNMFGQNWADGKIFPLHEDEHTDFYIAVCQGPIIENEEQTIISKN